MEELLTVLRSALGHAVAALEHEEQHSIHLSMTEYNSAWCDLCCASELSSGATCTVQGLLHEACPKLLESYRSRFEALRTRTGVRPSPPRASASGEPQRGDNDVGPSTRPAAVTASSSGNPGPACGARAVACTSVQPHVPAHPRAPAHSENGMEGTSKRLSTSAGDPGPAYLMDVTGTDQDNIGGGATAGGGGGSCGCKRGGSDAKAQGAVEDGAAAPAVPEMTEHMTQVLQICQRPVPEGASLDDLAGLGSVKEEVRMGLLLPMRMPHLFVGIRQPARNFLLHGPPGTGKTMLVERIAAEAGATLLVLTPGSILSKWSGESEKQLRAVFEVARVMQPCIVFMDEVDSLAPTRGSGDDPVARRVLNELLVQMSYLANGCCPAAPGAAAPGAGVYVFAATNRIQDCDPALLRRFDRRVEVPLPDLAAREAFLVGVLQRPEVGGHLLGSEDVRELAERTQGYSGSDLAQLAREAAMQPVRELLRDIAASGWAPLAGGVRRGAPQQHLAPSCSPKPRALSVTDFEQALMVIRPVGG